ncbi:MAG: phage portal protein [Propionibacteriaceae bacterium]|nr:phage portal protein [Propionibacteriaceae bacterium]
MTPTLHLRHHEEKALLELLTQLQLKQAMNHRRDQYYGAKNVLQSLGIAIPTELEGIDVVLGWPRKAVTALAKRCVLTGFSTPQGSDLGLGKVMWDSDLEVGSNTAHNEAARYGAHWIFCTTSEEGNVQMWLRSARQATCLWDHHRRAPRAALSVQTIDPVSTLPASVNLYLPGETIRLEPGPSGWVPQRYPQRYPGVPVVPLRHEPDTEHPFGTSRITQPVMALTDSGMRTWARSEVAAEFFSTPQRYLIGVSKDLFADDATGELRSQWESIIGRIWAIPPNENPDDPQPQVGQFSPASQQPHMEQLRQIASLLAGEISIPAEMLGIKQDANPSSDGALEVLERPLVQAARDAIRTFSADWRRAAVLAIQIRDGLDEPSEEALSIRATWMDPAMPSATQSSAAVTQQVNAGILPADCDIALERLGYSRAEIDQIKAHRALAAPSDVARLADVLARTQPDPQADTADMSGVKQQFEALGQAIRAGVDPAQAAERVGLSGLEFTGAVPVSLRLPEQQAQTLEDQ